MIQPLRIGVAVVLQDRHVLVGLRGAQQTLAGHAEFPGGKCHPGEEPGRCAERECLEETGIAVSAKRLLDERVHAYSDVAVEISFWQCTPNSAAELGGNHRGFRFVPIADLLALPFPAANRQTIELLTKGPG